MAYFMHADLFLDIFSTLFSLRRIDHLHSNRLFCLPVHQQPHSATTKTQMKDALQNYRRKQTRGF